MTDQPALPPASHARVGRHRPLSSRTRSRAVVGAAIVVTVVAGSTVVNLALGSNDPASGEAGPADAGRATSSACPLAAGELVVAAAPDIAPVLQEIAHAADSSVGSASCPVRVTALDPADFAESWQSGSQPHPDVWVPDSATWLATAADAGVELPQTYPAIALSPVVQAVSAATAAQLQATGAPVTLGALLSSRLGPTPVRVGLPDPLRSAAAVGTLLDVRAFVAGRADARAALTWALRSGPADLPTDSAGRLSSLADDAPIAVPVSEQSLWSHNTSGKTPAVAVYPDSGGFQLDYPYVVLGHADDTNNAAAGFLTTTRGATARLLLQASGFRDPDGLAGPALSAENGVDPAPRPPTTPAPRDAVADVVETFDLSAEPSRMLALLDVSASMRAIVPDSGGATRLSLAKDAAARGLALYPPDSELGLWTFSTDLTPVSDHAELIPVGPLTTAPDGSTGQQRIAAALAATEVKPFGGTGLYDSVLDAVREMRAGWKPQMVNSVIVLSDGQNDDDGISLDQLLATLAAEADPDRPVPVIAVAFGPDSDVDAMSQIAAATGGATYISADPRDVGEIFFDAVGQRLCRPEC